MSRFSLRLGVITALALAFRIGYLLAYRRDKPVGGDSFTYHYGANLLAQGHGFIDPLRYFLFGIVTPSAYHPPAYTVYLAAWSKIGVDGPLGHRMVSCLLGAASVGVVGLIGRELGSTRARGEWIGLIAAVLAALSPSLWINDLQLMSEPITALASALAVLALLRYRSRPTVRNAAVVGALFGLAALSRAELALLFPLLCIPMVRWASPRSRSEHWRRIAALGIAGALMVGPWVGYNLSRFEQPVYITTGLGSTLAGGACANAFEGPLVGYWAGCGAEQVAISVPPGTDRATPLGRAAIQRAARARLAKEGDESVRESEARHRAIDYIRAHESRLPVVVLARVGRVWGLFRPWQSATLDGKREGRGLLPARFALFGYALLAVGSIPGLVLLFRRRQPVSPFIALALIVTVATATSFGVQRYRVPFDVVMPVLAAVALEALWSRRRHRQTTPPDSGERSEQATSLTPIPRHGARAQRGDQKTQRVGE